MEKGVTASFTLGLDVASKATNQRGFAFQKGKKKEGKTRELTSTFFNFFLLLLLLTRAGLANDSDVVLHFLIA